METDEQILVGSAVITILAEIGVGMLSHNGEILILLGLISFILTRVASAASDSNVEKLTLGIIYAAWLAPFFLGLFVLPYFYTSSVVSNMLTSYVTWTSIPIITALIIHVVWATLAAELSKTFDL
jgi:TM2 domain-containing membrane protein YozV